jgi:hypothetical protein
MGKPLRWVGVLGLVGLVVGGVYGFVASRTIGCVSDGIGLPPDASCYRFLGLYVSGTTYYTIGAGLVGMVIGLVVGIFVAIPMVLWQRGEHAHSMHPLEYPLIWFGLQAVELLIIVPALLFWVPDPGEWPEALRAGLWLVVLIGVTFLNYGLRRRFIPR